MLVEIGTQHELQFIVVHTKPSKRGDYLGRGHYNVDKSKNNPIQDGLSNGSILLENLLLLVWK